MWQEVVKDGGHSPERNAVGATLAPALGRLVVLTTLSLISCSSTLIWQG